ncbi:ATP-binding cassette domain-containing protein [Clostridium baratii]|uniref:ATP-binding cassette domain-containing protein n=1 Tax=Clostridium baratii TaxID=1561 RepID=UPI0030CEE48A
MIEIINLYKKYGKSNLFNNINFKISDNSFAFIMGANGEGKTTLFKCLLDLEKFKGDILFDGEPFLKIIKNIFAIYDDVPFYTNLTGFQNIKLVSYKKIQVDDIDENLQLLLSIDKLNKKVSTYSYGEKKKLAILIAILLKPKYLIIDELSNGLDFETISWLRENIKIIFKKSTIIATGQI